MDPLTALSVRISRTEVLQVPIFLFFSLYPPVSALSSAKARTPRFYEYVHAAHQRTLPLVPAAFSPGVLDRQPLRSSQSIKHCGPFATVPPQERVCHCPAKMCNAAIIVPMKWNTCSKVFEMFVAPLAWPSLSALSHNNVFCLRRSLRD